MQLKKGIIFLSIKKGFLEPFALSCSVYGSHYLSEREIFLKFKGKKGSMDR